ncbi:hypothetical protein G6F31_015079 [Rhizopus arrhizus]|nr:hypothetical protein G6F31_015079 [Rhizopus arrhizus]
MIRKTYGLDRPLAVQYADWLWHILQGDFGTSVYFKTEAGPLILSKLKTTLLLGMGALGFALLISIPLGVLAALYKGSLIDRICLAIAVLGQALPNFFFALILIMLFSISLRILPVSGSGTWQHFVMPAIALGYYVAPAFMRLIRAGKVGNVRILDAAVQPDRPVRPKAAIIIGVATAIGLIFGMLCAFVRNALFGGLSEPEDVERYTGLPVLAAIPYSDMQDKLWRRSRRKNATVPALLAQSQGNAPPIESLRSFRNVLQASLRQSANNMVMFTGPVAGVGKSFLSANFAFIQGGVGKRVLLIDAAFRKGQLNRYFGVPKEDGLFEVLSGPIPLPRAR